METTRQHGDDIKPCPSGEVQCEVLDLSTKRLPSATSNSSSSFLPYSCPSSPPEKIRHLSTSVTYSTQDASEVESYYSTVHTAATTLTDTPYRTLRALTGPEAEATYSVQSISPGTRTSNDHPREHINDARRYARHVEYSPYSFAQLQGISPVTHPRPPHFEMPPAIGTFPFNAAAAAAAASPFIRGFPGLGQPLLTDMGSSLGSVHPHMDFASAAAAAAATAFPSYLQRRRRRGQRCSDPSTTPCSPHLSQHPSAGPRATDDDCSRDSGNGRIASSRNSEERSHSEEKDPAYLERRRKNNEAAKRSRDARRQKEEEIASRAATLEQENITLKAELLLLRRESAELHSLLYGRIDPQR